VCHWCAADLSERSRFAAALCAAMRWDEDDDETDAADCAAEE
jgi:hypothetical protein